jgi:hypothetical protein
MSRTVVVKSASGLRQTVIIGSYHFLADETKDVGGTDETAMVAEHAPVVRLGPRCAFRKCPLVRN